MTNRKRLAAVCLALMALGIVGEGAALASRPPQPATPPGRGRPEGQDDVKRPSHACDPSTGGVNRGGHPGGCS